MRDKLALIGALTVLGASMFWLGLNMYLIHQITLMFPGTHYGSYGKAMHDIVHLGLIAVMIFIEWWIGLRMLRFQAAADFAAWFQRKPWLGASCGPTPAIAILVFLLATVFFTDREASAGAQSNAATIVYKFGKGDPLEVQQLQVLIAIGFMALLVRMYAWLQHADTIHLNAGGTP